MITDVINSLIEIVGGGFVWLNCYRLFKDKQTYGVSILTGIVFTLMAFWHLYYFPHLSQWISLLGCFVGATGNFVWVALAVFYKHESRKESCHESK